MDAFLTLLYFKKFEISQEHQRLMGMRDFPSDAEAHRHDQRITEIVKREKDMDWVIEKYMNMIVKA